MLKPSQRVIFAQFAPLLGTRSLSMNANLQILVSEDNFQNYGRIQDFMPHISGVVSMDNPEYILQEAKRRGTGAGSGNYHTLGIPVIPSPTASSSGPSSLPAPPYTSLSSTASSSLNTASNNSAGQPQGQSTTQTGLNGAVLHPGQPRSSDGESDHEYYNDVDRLKREMQPLQQQQQQQQQQQPRNETTV